MSLKVNFFLIIPTFNTNQSHQPTTTYEKSNPNCCSPAFLAAI